MAERDPFDDRTTPPDSWPTDYRPRISSPADSPDLISRLSGLLQDILIVHFSSADSIFLPSLRSLLWYPDEKRRQIVIESFGRWDPRQAGMKPSLVVRRLAAEATRLGIGDRNLHFHPATISNLHLVRQWTGGLEVVAADRSAIRADELAAEVRQHFQVFAGRIVQTLCLSSFEVVGLGELGKPELFKSVEGAKDLFGVSVMIRYTLQENWELVPENPLIESVSVSHNPDCPS